MDATIELSVVPPGRLGAVLFRARNERGQSIDELADRAGDRFSLDDLLEVEAGRYPLQDADIKFLSGLYDVHVGQLLANRSQLVIDLDRRTLKSGEHERRLPKAKAGKDALLSSYLATVYEMRKISPGRAIPLRVDDLTVLGTALDSDPEAIRADLVALMERPDELVAKRIGLLRKSVIVPAAGVLIGATAIGLVVLVQSWGDSAPTSRPAPTAEEVKVDAAPGAVAVLEPATVQRQDPNAPAPNGTPVNSGTAVATTSPGASSTPETTVPVAGEETLPVSGDPGEVGLLDTATTIR